MQTLFISGYELLGQFSKHVSWERNGLDPPQLVQFEGDPLHVRQGASQLAKILITLEFRFILQEQLKVPGIRKVFRGQLGKQLSW